MTYKTNLLETIGEYLTEDVFYTWLNIEHIHRGRFRLLGLTHQYGQDSYLCVIKPLYYIVYLPWKIFWFGFYKHYDRYKHKKELVEKLKNYNKACFRKKEELTQKNNGKDKRKGSTTEEDLYRYYRNALRDATVYNAVYETYTTGTTSGSTAR